MALDQAIDLTGQGLARGCRFVHGCLRSNARHVGPTFLVHGVTGGRESKGMEIEAIAFQLAHGRDHGGGIDPTGERRPYGHVRSQVQFDRVHE